jgi:S-methyl-5-thioribulose 1-phosphate isomerase
MDALRVTYRLRVDAPRAAARAEQISREQTVEVPRSVVRDAFIEREILGRVESVRPDPGDPRVSLATIAYPLATTALDPAQLLNVMFGNTSLQEDAACVDCELPQALLEALAGPRFGLAGLRRALGVFDRALTCTAAKPMGHSPKALADLVRSFARAGIDVVKDDQGLADHAFCPFEDRVRACLDAADEIADETGHRVLYVPNLIGTPDTVLRQLDFAHERGAGAVMVSPMLIGLPFFWELCHRHSSLPVLAHPSLGGAQRFAPELLFGSLLRLYGADAVIFVGFSGRFGTPREACRSLVDRLRRPWGGLLPALPVAGGGVELEQAAELVSFYGRDSMLLVGGSLQVEPGALERRSRSFAEAVRAASEELV